MTPSVAAFSVFLSVYDLKKSRSERDICMRCCMIGFGIKGPCLRKENRECHFTNYNFSLMCRYCWTPYDSICRLKKRKIGGRCATYQRTTNRSPTDRVYVIFVHDRSAELNFDNLSLFRNTLSRNGLNLIFIAAIIRQDWFMTMGEVIGFQRFLASLRP